MDFKKYRYTIIDCIVLFLNLAILEHYYPLDYIFLASTVTGGDTGSHVQTFQYLRNYLLPNGKVIGWYPGNYGGYPFFLLYFPLLFVAGAVLSFFININIAINIMTAIGIYILPITAYISIRIVGWRFPAAIIASTLSLFFIFNFSNSMWGGNIYSNLAGEFTYSFSFSLTFVFLALVYRLLVLKKDLLFEQKKADFLWAIFTFCLIGFTHGFTLIFCLLSSLFFLCKQKKFLHNFSTLFSLYAISGLLMAGWMLQLIIAKPFTTDWGHKWVFVDWGREFFDMGLLPGLVLFPLLSCFFYIQKYLHKSERDLSYLNFVWFMIFISIFCFYLSPILHLPDIRFLPFIQYLTTVTGGALLGVIFVKTKSKYILPFFMVSFTCLGLLHMNVGSDYLAKWNHQGIEGKFNYNIFKNINNSIREKTNNKRVVYENHTKANSFGTIRAFENLYMTAQRPTLEGLYMQSSLLSPSVFYLQSLYSDHQSCPFVEYPCTSTNIKRSYMYFDLFAVNTMLSTSEKLNNTLKKNEDYHLLDNFGFDYHLWQLKKKTSYVEVLKTAPKYIEANNWRITFYKWFMKYESDSQFLYTVPTKRDMFYNFPEIDLGTLSFEKDCRVEEVLQEETISFRTNCLRRPHLVKVNYHPGWKVKGADGPYLISPGMMMVIPNTSKVEMKFYHEIPRLLGFLATVLGLILLLFVIFRKDFCIPVKIKEKYFYRAFIFILGVLLLRTVYMMQKPSFSTAFSHAEKVYTERKYLKAQELFLKMKEEWKDNLYIDKVGYFLGLSYYLNSQEEQAVEVFKELITRPYNLYLAEAYYYLGICYYQLGKNEKSKESLNYIINNLQDSQWYDDAERLLGEYEF